MGSNPIGSTTHDGGIVTSVYKKLALKGYGDFSKGTLRSVLKRFQEQEIQKDLDPVLSPTPVKKRAKKAKEKPYRIFVYSEKGGWFRKRGWHQYRMGFSSRDNRDHELEKLRRCGWHFYDHIVAVDTDEEAHRLLNMGE